MGDRIRSRGCLATLALWGTATIAVAALLFAGVVAFMDRPEKAIVPVLYAVDVVVCGLGFCEPGAPDDMTLTLAHESLGESPLVAIDVDTSGRLFAAHSERLDSGALDNRDFTEDELDEELALRTVDDRRAMIERAIARGRFAAEDFTMAADMVAVFEDTDGDGRLETRTELARTNDPAAGIGAGVLVRGADIYWADVPNVWRLRDTDADGMPDQQEILSTGWGVRWAFGGHDLHGLVQGPDGKIYFSVGDRGFEVETPDGRVLRPDIDNGRGAVLRMNPDGSGLEIYAQGLRNPQELAFDDYGNLFTADNNSDSIDQARIVYLVEGGDSGWAMPYQLLREEEYERGPWNAEKLWNPEHEGQPAYVIPPLRYIGRGPAGFMHAPGLGLPERYRNHFFAADYAYVRPISGIRTFRVEEDGAGFRSTEPEWFLTNVLATDMVLTLDGAMYVSTYQHIPPQRGKLYRLEMNPDVAEPQAARLREMAEILRGGMGHRSEEELGELLGFEDRRVRMPAQFELVARGAAPVLGRVARDRHAPLLARVHALWGLGQLGAASFRVAGWTDNGWVVEAPAEVRAQAIKVIGVAGADSLAADVVPFLRDESARVRYFAAITLGKLGDATAATALLDMLRENGGDDVYLRHAGALALYELDDPAVISVAASDPAASVRMAALLAMRRGRVVEIARFLSDPDPRLVVEAARAIHDLPIEGARPRLAALAGTPLPYRDEDPQTTYALHRRVLNENLRLGTREAALRIGAHAADSNNPEAMRREALAALRQFRAPSPRDAVLGIWSPLPSRPPEVVYEALDTYVPALLNGEFEGEALEVAASYDHVPLEDDALLERVVDAAAAPRVRIASLHALGTRAEGGGSSDALGKAVAAAIDSADPGLRAEARDVLAGRDPGAALRSISTVEDDAPLLERQRAIETLAAMKSPQADAAIAARMERLVRGDFPADARLDVLEAARGRGGPVLTALVARFDASLDPSDPLAPYRVAVHGGDPALGRAVFNGNGDCKRCHSIDGGGGTTGPPLDGLAGRFDRAAILEAIILPDATIATGYAQGAEGSAMPPIAIELPPRELRDLMSFLASLN